MFRYALALLVAVSIIPLTAEAEPNDLLLPSESLVEGRTVSQLTADWWQWAMSIPADSSPLRDLTGSNCAVGQQGPVWFLAGGFGSSKIHRSCTIPEGKMLLFPLVNMSYWRQNANQTFTCEQAKASAAFNNETAIDLFAEIDGVALDELKRHRVSTDECFNVYGRIPPEQQPYNAYPSASDGYWLLMKPLQKGTHVIKFGGRYNRNSRSYGHMVQDIEYELIVK